MVLRPKLLNFSMIASYDAVADRFSPLVIRTIELQINFLMIPTGIAY